MSGIARRLDKLGRLVIPSEARRALRWTDHTPIEIHPFSRYLLLCAENDTGSANTIPPQSPISQELQSALYQLSAEDQLFTLEFLRRITGENGLEA